MKRFYMKLEDLKILQYELDFDDTRGDSIILERIYGINCERFGIRRGGSVLGKEPDEYGYFHFQREPIPSSRDDEFYAEYRWSSVEEALEFWNTNRAGIIATSSEYHVFYNKYCSRRH